MTSAFTNYVNKEFSGDGNITFNDGAQYQGKFQIYLFNAGNLNGSILFRLSSSNLGNRLSQGQTFTVNGELENGLKIQAEDCACYSYIPFESNNSSFPLKARFQISRLKIYDESKLKKIENPDAKIYFHFGILNYYAQSSFSLNTEVGVIKSKNFLSDEEIAIFKYSFIPFISASFDLEFKGQHSLENKKILAFQVLSKLLDLTSFALNTEHRCSHYKIYFDDLNESKFAYSECINRLPRLPDSHNNIDDTRLQDFLNLTYESINEEIENRYSFSLALKWYLDSVSLRYDIMQFISAYIALESLLGTLSEKDESILGKSNFDKLYKKFEGIMATDLRGVITDEDFESMLRALSNINWRHTQRKAKQLLESLKILDDETRESLREVTKLRNKIIHTGRFKISNSNEKIVVNTYFKLFRLLRFS